MTKPKLLYHGSPACALQIIEPRQKNIRHSNEGPVVFANEQFEFALMFMSPRADDSWTFKFGHQINTDITWYYIISDEQRFTENDTGGSVYEVQSDTFYQETDFGMRTEWVSKESVGIVKEYHFESTLRALLEHGVNVYFVNRELFQEIKNTPGRARIEILSKLDKK